MKLLEVQRVSKHYSRPRLSYLSTANANNINQDILALDRFSASIEVGTATGVIGESGAGKTTVARIVAGVEKPSSGIVLINGSEIAGLNRLAKKQMARMAQMIWQDAPACLDPRQKIGPAIAEPFIIHGHAGKPANGINDRVARLLQEVGLSTDFSSRYPHQLSGGEAQRVVIARALALEPALLICDEPASALDIHAKAGIARLLGRLRHERNLALLVVTHDLSLIRWLTDEVIVLKEGQIVEQGATREILTQPKDPYTRKLIESEPQLRRV